MLWLWADFYKHAFIPGHACHSRVLPAASSDRDRELFDAPGDDHSCREPWGDAPSSCCFLYSRGTLPEAFNGQIVFPRRTESFWLEETPKIIKSSRIIKSFLLRQK